MKLLALAVGSAIATANAAALGDRSQFDERAAYAVIGKPEGFASGTTGGGSAACAIPSSVAQLKTWLTDSTARCIVLDKEWVSKFRMILQTDDLQIQLQGQRRHYNRDRVSTSIQQMSR